MNNCLKLYISLLFNAISQSRYASTLNYEIFLNYQSCSGCFIYMSFNATISHFLSPREWMFFLYKVKNLNLSLFLHIIEVDLFFS